MIPISKKSIKKAVEKAAKDEIHDSLCSSPRIMQDGHNLGCPYFNYKKKLNFTGLDYFIK